MHTCLPRKASSMQRTILSNAILRSVCAGAVLLAGGSAHAQTNATPTPGATPTPAQAERAIRDATKPPGRCLTRHDLQISVDEVLDISTATATLNRFRPAPADSPCATRQELLEALRKVRPAAK